jgi:hypothetical protein
MQINEEGRGNHNMILTTTNYGTPSSTMKRRRNISSSRRFETVNNTTVFMGSSSQSRDDDAADCSLRTGIGSTPQHQQQQQQQRRPYRRRLSTGTRSWMIACSTTATRTASSSSSSSIHLLLVYCYIFLVVVVVNTFSTYDRSGVLMAEATTTTDSEEYEGTFNGYPIKYRVLTSDSSTEQQPHAPAVETIVHCVGENYQNTKSWMHRSCEFTEMFCFDVETKDYVVFQNQQDQHIYKYVDAKPLLDISQSYLKQSTTRRNTVSLGGINLKWSMHPTKGIPRLEWFPEIRNATDYNANSPLKFYELPKNVVMVPFHSMNGANPGHLVWDDFLPIWTLMTMFQMDELEGKSKKELLMMRYILKDSAEERGLWASCDWNEDKKEACHKMMHKFLPLMMGEEAATKHGLSTTEDFQFRLNEDGGGESIAKTSLVCSRHGIAGIGPLTDHGTYKLHGWEDADYTSTHNHGRGGMLYEFRNFMLSNLNLPTTLKHKPPFRIVFSLRSSEAGRRAFDFKKQQLLLKESFQSSYVSVEGYVFAELSLREQLEIATQTSIFITSCGGGAVTGMFLPKGGSVIMYYPESGGLVGNKPNGNPARLDWGTYDNNTFFSGVFVVSVFVSISHRSHTPFLLRLS